MSKSDYSKLEKTFEYWHNNPPAPFNPEFRPDHKQRSEKVRRMVEKGEPYSTREERAAAFKEAYDSLDS